MKKRTIAAVSAGVILCVSGGGYGIYHMVKNHADPVEVQSVSSLNSGWWGENSSTQGIITSNATQEIHLQNDELVDKLYVKEGDKVKIGDKLLSYDTTLLELDLESEKLERRSIQLKMKSAEQDLEKLKKITPIPDGQLADAGAGSQAALIKTEAVMTATSGQPAEGGDQAPETQVPEKPKEDVFDPGQETEEKPQKTPLDRIKATDKLNYQSKSYKGSGTQEDPYVFFCKEKTTIYASFMNKILGFNESGTSRKDGGMKEDGKGSYALLEIREGDSVGGGFVKSISINGTVKADKAYAPDVTWTYSSDGVTKNIPEVDEPQEDDPDDMWGDMGDFGDDVYTVTELKEAIKEKEDEIKDLKLDLRESKLNVAQAQRKLNEAIVTAKINGVVKSVGDPELGEVDGEAFMLVTSNEGLYVRGTISELKLGKVQEGTTMTGMSYESGTSFTAEITEISEYPGSRDYWSSNEPSASYYPFMAYIEEPGELTNNEYVELTIDENTGVDSSAIYLYKAYIRSENGQSYVYKADEDNRLVKQYIKTGATLYSSSVEVKSGLTLEDRIAFPYGKNVTEGARVKDDESMDEAILE